MKILNIPIEPIGERYSVQWDRWFTDYLEKSGLDYTTVYGNETSGIIQTGSFLDVIETNEYKTTQLLGIIQILKNWKSKETLVLFFHDLWFPGLPTIAYIRDGLKLNIKICGCLHAGSYDPHDFLTKMGMGIWASHSENSWWNIVDLVFLATNYHAQLLWKNRIIHFDKIKVTGFPIFPIIHSAYKENIVVFPHRLDDEKNPEEFTEFSKLCNTEEFDFLRTKDLVNTKEGYFSILETSTFAFSSAYQETWGIAMQEAVLCGCIPIVPNRLSYSEMYLAEFKYNSLDEAVEMFHSHCASPPIIALRKQKEMIEEKGCKAIPNIFTYIQTLDG